MLIIMKKVTINETEIGTQKLNFHRELHWARISPNQAESNEILKFSLSRTLIMELECLWKV